MIFVFSLCKVYNLFSNVICQYVTAHCVKMSYCKYNFVCVIVSYCTHSYVILSYSMAKREKSMAKRVKAGGPGLNNVTFVL